MAIYSLTQFLFHSAWQPHDVQEFFRVMFDALEKRFLRDKDCQQEMQGDLINELYQGTWEVYVKCKGVSNSPSNLYTTAIICSLCYIVWYC